MDELEKKIEQVINQNRSKANSGDRNVYEPDAHDFYLFIQKKLSDSDEAKMLEYVTQNTWAQNMLMDISSNEMANEKAVPNDLLQKTKNQIQTKYASKQITCPHCQKPITPFKKPLNKQIMLSAAWLLVAIIAFTLSFVFKGYFMQCLAISIICAFKFIIEQKQTKTQIMIYRALKEELNDVPKNRLKDLHKEHH